MPEHTAADVGEPVSLRSQVFLYDSLFRGLTLALHPDREAVSIGETVLASVFCSGDSGYYCFDAREFHFAVPRSYSCDIESWEFAGHIYKRIAPAYERRIFGRNMQVCVIHSEFEGVVATSSSIRYLFSPTDGLLAIEIDFAGPTGLRDLFVLRDGAGFGVRCDAC